MRESLRLIGFQSFKSDTCLIMTFSTIEHEHAHTRNKTINYKMKLN